MRVEGAAAFADALKSNLTLTKLSLAGNEIGADGAALIVDALGHTNHCTLHYLDLSMNKMGVVGAARIADQLQRGFFERGAGESGGRKGGGGRLVGSRGTAAAAQARLNKKRLGSGGGGGGLGGATEVDEMFGGTDRPVTSTSSLAAAEAALRGTGGTGQHVGEPGGGGAKAGEQGWGR
jgi:hypothetical protein